MIITSDKNIFNVNSNPAYLKHANLSLEKLWLDIHFWFSFPNIEQDWLVHVNNKTKHVEQHMCTKKRYAA